jgi:hypothetical protein
MEIDFLSMTLEQAGFSGLQLTGPALHNNVPPFPGTFSPGQDDRMPGLVVLVSTTNDNLPGFSGPAPTWPTCSTSPASPTAPRTRPNCGTPGSSAPPSWGRTSTPP